MSPGRLVRSSIRKTVPLAVRASFLLCKYHVPGCALPFCNSCQTASQFVSDLNLRKSLFSPPSAPQRRIGRGRVMLVSLTSTFDNCRNANFSHNFFKKFFAIPTSFAQLKKEVWWGTALGKIRAFSTIKKSDTNPTIGQERVALFVKCEVVVAYQPKIIVLVGFKPSCL